MPSGHRRASPAGCSTSASSAASREAIRRDFPQRRHGVRASATSRRELSLTLEPTDLEAVVEEVASAFAPRAAADEVELTTSFHGSPELSVDPARIRQVLENLVANALRHTPAGGAVSIGLSRRDDELELTVSDTGPGIVAEQLDSIFDRYARSGGRLGLAIARSLVEAHGEHRGGEPARRRGDDTRAPTRLVRRDRDDAALAVEEHLGHGQVEAGAHLLA
jgi:signal transduction histidine kinase